MISWTSFDNFDTFHFYDREVAPKKIDEQD